MFRYSGVQCTGTSTHFLRKTKSYAGGEVIIVTEYCNSIDAAQIDLEVVSHFRWTCRMIHNTYRSANPSTALPEREDLVQLQCHNMRIL
jgi:hypothetical protein